MKAVWELGKEDFDFFTYLQDVLVVVYTDGMTEESFKDTNPLMRHEDNSSDRCYFHCHSKDFDCRGKKSEDLPFVPNKKK